MKINTHWSKSVRVLTILIGGVLLGAEISWATDLSSAWNIVPFISVPLLMLYSVWEIPMSLTLTDDKLIINRLAGHTGIDFMQISTVEVYKGNGSDLRLFGSGGFGGYWGVFYNDTIGRYRSYVGDYAQAFWIKTKEGKSYVLSCENRDLVIQTIKEKQH